MSASSLASPACAAKSGESVPFWLSHHPEAEANRTFNFGGLRVCARCLATYPTAFAFIAAQFARKAPLGWQYDVLVGTALLIPALADWAYGRFRPHAGNNVIRVVTGLMLGIALGRSLYIHLQKPLPTVLLLQLGLSVLVAVPVLLWTYSRQNTDIDRS